MDLSKNRTALAVGVVATGIVTTAVLAAIAWPALTRPDPPSEASGDGGLRIRVVEPPKASVARGDPLDVGLSEVAQAMTKGREALLVATPPVRPEPIRRAPRPVAQVVEDEADVAPPTEPVDDQWERSRQREDRFERAQRLRWEEDERLAQREQERERREDERYAPPPLPDEDHAPPSGRW
uniref:Uncharacterized protein n=1 Tax=Caulobacter sp. (strain K31) TaxID=366602 RepID=B0SYQ4_CAUSK